MKFSEAMLKGYMTNGGRQCRGEYSRVDASEVSYCPIGAAIAGGYTGLASLEFFDAWGVTPITANDSEELPWEHIYGMAVAAGL